MSDTVTIHNGYCSYHGPAEKAPAWAPNVLKSDVAGELRREKFQHGGKAANTRYSTPSDTQPSGRDPVHDNSDITKTAKRVSHIFSAPLTSFEDTTHAWEEGYRAGRAAGLCWNRTVDGTPRKPGLRDYEQIECLIMLPNGNIEIALWNCEHLVWDDEHGDDYRHDAGYPTHWIDLAPLRTAVALRALESKA